MEAKKGKIREKLPKIGIGFVLILVGITLFTFAIGATIVTGVFTNDYTNSQEMVNYQFDNLFFNLLLVIIALGLLYLINQLLKKVKAKYIFISVIVLFVIFSLVFIWFSQTPLRADQRKVEEAARGLIAGTNELFQSRQYMDMHPLQISIVLFIELIYRISGIQSQLVIKCLNVVFSVVALIYLYRITDLLFQKERTKKTLSLLILGCPVFVFWTTFVYGNIVGLMFGVMAIFYTLKYLEDKKIRYLILMAITILLAAILKSNYQVYMIGIIIVLILDLFKKFDGKIIIAILGILLIAGISSKALIKFMEIRLGQEISDGIPMISYIEMSFSKPLDRASGWYNAATNVEKTYIESGFDSERAAQISKERIQKRFKEMASEPKETLFFFADKVASTWLEPTYQSIWINEPAEEIEDNPEYFPGNKLLISFYQGTVNKMIVKYLDVLQIIIFTSAGIYIVLNRKKITNKEALMLIIFFGGVLFHIIWETKSLYVIPYYILLFPYAAEGLEPIFTKVEEEFKRTRVKKLEENKKVKEK